ncbi:TPA: hypothetical protein U1D13_000771 [Streptococcus suis]|nr:hypothetical protein [Streptococcus suis]HEM3630392.1 hypothetical protein [Streptococcus suis]HEM3652350.1 hypothetical protein [Streptococcus suis]HEM3714749.1 hypothetical protein [Streptococcus suis]
MNQEQQLIQAQSLTIQNLSTQLTEALTTKNLLAVQLTTLQQENDTLMQQLEEATKPAEVEEGE